MKNAAVKRERAEQILGELAELGLILARDLAAEARAAEAPEQKAALAEAFQAMARTACLTVALDAKFDRDAAFDARDVKDAALTAPFTTTTAGNVAPAKIIQFPKPAGAG